MKSLSREDTVKIINVVGARPNFMKIAPIVRAMERAGGIKQILVHTGQHYDAEMSDFFFKDLELPRPDIYLGVGSGSHAEQTARIMVAFEKIVLNEKPDLVIVVGDVNSTLACALVAAKLQIPLAHVEAGLRSFDRTMPEEINRIVTDALADYLFITEKSAEKNLLNEGIDKKKIFFVGNVMIDTLVKSREKAERSSILSTLRLEPRAYALLTLHRPSNVDDKETLEHIFEALEEMLHQIKIVYPIHPRSLKKIKEFNLDSKFAFLSDDKQKAHSDGFMMVNPLGYLDFLKLMTNAALVLTDSGGIQEETTVLGIPCLTLRRNTERPATVEQGTNIIVGVEKDKIIAESRNIINGKSKINKIPERWDGKAAERIVDILLRLNRKRNT